MDFEYQNYQLQNVYRSLTEAQRTEIVSLWVKEKALTLEEASRRTDEVAFLIRNPQGELAGVNTVYMGDFLQAKNPYYFMRLFIRKADRGILNLRREVTFKTREFLKFYEGDIPKPKGIVVVMENPKYWRKGARRGLERDGWNYYGKGPKGNDVWYENFDGSLIEKI